MLSHFRAMFDDSRRGDDRIGPAGDPSAPTQETNAFGSDKPPVLRRQTVNAFAILGIVIILYGTLVPFEVCRDATLRWDLGWTPPAPGDTVSNLLVYVPVGVLLRLIVRRRGSSRLWEYGWSLSMAGGLSYLTELIQTVLPARVPSWTDVALNFSGALIGVVLAPAFQSALRNMHAYLYQKLRREPFAAAAAAIMLGLCTYALAPPDIHPSPGHVAASIQRLRATPAPWSSFTGDVPGRTPRQAIDKVVAAGAYALLASVLLLSAREAGRSLAASTWYASSRSILLATVIEGMQLFTISHTADPGDLTAAWLASVAGAVVACLLVRRHREMHHHPGRVLRGIVAGSGLVLLTWAIATIALSPRSGPPARVCWLPLFHDFHRSWNALLGDYTTGLFQYGMVAALLALWYRSRGRRPGRLLVLGGVLVAASLGGFVAVCRDHGFDTAHIGLALLAGVVVLRLDRAVFGHRHADLDTESNHLPALARTASEPPCG